MTTFAIENVNLDRLNNPMRNTLAKMEAQFGEALVQWLWDVTQIKQFGGSNPSTGFWVGHFSHLF